MAAAVPPIPIPRTIRGRVLLGWLKRDDAVRYLLNDCYFNPPLAEQDAEQLWRPYRDRTEALQEREALAPQRLPLNHAESAHEQRFLTFLRSLGPSDIGAVIKVDVSQLVAHQYVVLTEKSEAYRQRVGTGHAWLNETLPCQIAPLPMMNVRYLQNGFNTALDVDLPHGEFAFLPDQGGNFSPRQLLRHVTVLQTGNRMWLWAGYHRTFAFMLAMRPTAAVPNAVVALTRNTLLPANQPAGAAGGLPDDIGPFGRRPALLGDFFNPDFFIDVNLRKKRYQLQMRSTLLTLDDSV